MVELQHGPVPAELLAFLEAHPGAPVDLFNDGVFQDAKRAIKAVLNGLQGGLCVYCEQKLTPTGGQLEHIKPKRGPCARADLCFAFENLAQSCNKLGSPTCGPKKADLELPIEPGPGCNEIWRLSTGGRLEPIPGLTPKRLLAANVTLEVLGLNADSGLVFDRDLVLSNVLEVLKEVPDGIDAFLRSQPYRYILAASI
jgi:uncharacterized protein (TIGR02646 family)